MEHTLKPKLILIYTALLLALGITAVQAQTPAAPVAVILPAGQSLSVSCASDVLTVEGTGTKNVRLSCATVTATPVPATATPVATVAPTATPMPDHSSMGWHAPGGHGGIPAHEHGAMPPTWVTDAGYTPMFTHAANTPNVLCCAERHASGYGLVAS